MERKHFIQRSDTDSSLETERISCVDKTHGIKKVARLFRRLTERYAQILKIAYVRWDPSYDSNKHCIFIQTVRVKGGMSLRNVMWHDLRNAWHNSCGIWYLWNGVMKLISIHDRSQPSPFVFSRWRVAERTTAKNKTQHARPRFTLTVIQRLYVLSIKSLHAYM